MIEERGRIVALEGEAIWVETVQRSGCNGCAAKSGCGTGLLGDFWAKASQVRVDVTPESLKSLALHDTVVIGIAENTLATTALVVYLLPLITLVIGALGGQWLGSELWAIAGALGGLATGALAIRIYSHLNRRNPSMAPQFLRCESVAPCAVVVTPAP
ncbi:SoxR reducing system RseC family protein [Microbulbifer sp. ALW1]|uniref:SoxR reducing system RseC family protein n=1 Tax=Microbulbifer sp. (strain ALW1) TaxID=1516059 RepID=UPI001359311B|nr:SoxR reducing system RseC family protein [Microbulbifer sp. ALW1]